MPINLDLVYVLQFYVPGITNPWHIVLVSLQSSNIVQLEVEIWLVASLDMIHSNKPMTKVLIRLCGCAG